MNDLFSSFGVSSVIHVALVPVVSLMIQNHAHKTALVPIELVDIPRVEEKKPEVLPPPLPAPKPKPHKIVPPKLVSKPEPIATPAVVPAGNTKEEVKEPEPPPQQPLASLPPHPGPVEGAWKAGDRQAKAEGSATGAGNLFANGDVGVVGGSGVQGGGGGDGRSGLGRSDKGDGSGGGGIHSGEALSGLARPLGGYQVKPRYPDSARRAGIQGITLLKLRILENGKVGQVTIEKTAGHPDLDRAAAEAVKKWLFEPARRGKEPVAVWVLLPVQFQLH
jgi:protein TonB